MKVGDLVKVKCPSRNEIGKTFVIVDMLNDCWVLLYPRHLFGEGWNSKKDYEVVSESR